MYKDYPLFFGKTETASFDKALINDDNMKGTMSFRIPALITCDDGTLIACADRASTGADWGKIDIAVRRSTDCGKTWSEMDVITNMPTRSAPQNGEDTASAFAIDPVLCKAANGDILLLFDMWPESKGLHDRTRLDSFSGYVNIGGRPCLALFTDKMKSSKIKAKTQTGYSCYTVRDDCFVYDENGKKTDMYLPKKHDAAHGYATLGDLYVAVGEPDYIDKCPPLIPKMPKDGEDIYIGNIFLNVAQPPLKDKRFFVQKRYTDHSESAYDCLLTKPAPLRAAITSYIWCMRSTDGGKTWSQPVDLNPQIRIDKDGEFFGVTPGRGLTLEKQAGMEKGRILVPVYNLEQSAVIYSDDGGKTWNRNLDKYIPVIGENQFVELPDGAVIVFSRPRLQDYPRTAISLDGGYTWKKAPKSEFLTVQCNKSLITLPEQNGKNYVLASHPTGKRDKRHPRSRGVITIGEIDTAKHTIRWFSEYELTAPERASLGEFSDFFAYSCMTLLPNGEIGILYECYPSGYITFRSVPIGDILIGNPPATL